MISLICRSRLSSGWRLADPNGPSVDEMMPFWRKIQPANKALLISSELDPDVVEAIANELEPKKLAFCISTAEPAVYNEPFEN